MKTSKYLILFAAVMFQCFSVNSQEALLNNGSLQYLKEQTSLNIEFVYTDMKVGEFTEDIYLQQKRKEYRKPADGDKFVKKWSTDRIEIYEPKFIEQFNKEVKKINMVAAKNASTAKYTLLVQTVRMEPGFYDGTNSSKRNTFVDLFYKIVETQNRENIIATVKADWMVGLPEDPYQMKETTYRVTAAYKLAAEKIGLLIVKVCSQKEKTKKNDDDEPKHPGKQKNNKKDKYQNSTEDE